MDALTGAVEPQVVLVVAAIAVLVLFALLLVRILQASTKLILIIATIVLAVNYLFGISPNQLLSEVVNLPQEAIQLVRSVDLTALTSVFQG